MGVLIGRGGQYAQVWYISGVPAERRSLFYMMRSVSLSKGPKEKSADTDAGENLAKLYLQVFVPILV